MQFVIDDLGERGRVNLTRDERLVRRECANDVEGEPVVIDLPEMKCEVNRDQDRERDAGQDSDSLWRHRSIVPRAGGAGKTSVQSELSKQALQQASACNGR